MPKHRRSKSRRRNNRHHPYAGKNPNGMEDDVDMKEDVGTSGEDARVVVFTTTRGRILQRHKLEWKDLRKKIQKIRTERLRYSKKIIGQRDARKELTNEMKTLREELETRHTEELRAFAEKQAKAGVTAVEIFKSRRSRKKRQKIKKNRKANVPSDSQAMPSNVPPEPAAPKSDFQFSLSANPVPKTSIQAAGGSKSSKNASADGDVAMSDA